MSTRCTSWVFDNADVAGSEFCVLLAIADECDWEGLNGHPNQDRIARRARVARSTVPDLIRRLEAAGEIVVKRPARSGRGHYNTYALVMGREPEEVRALAGLPAQKGSGEQTLSTPGAPEAGLKPAAESHGQAAARDDSRPAAPEGLSPASDGGAAVQSEPVESDRKRSAGQTLSSKKGSGNGLETVCSERPVPIPIPKSEEEEERASGRSSKAPAFARAAVTEVRQALTGAGILVQWRLDEDQVLEVARQLGRVGLPAIVEHSLTLRARSSIAQAGYLLDAWKHLPDQPFGPTEQPPRLSFADVEHCGRCDPVDRRIEAADGSVRRCPDCHPGELNDAGVFAGRRRTMPAAQNTA